MATSIRSLRLTNDRGETVTAFAGHERGVELQAHMPEAGSLEPWQLPGGGSPAIHADYRNAAPATS